MTLNSNTAKARMRDMNPLDVLTLAEAYGEKAVQEMKCRFGTKKAILAYDNARRAFHHAITFCNLDDSYRRRW